MKKSLVIYYACQMLLDWPNIGQVWKAGYVICILLCRNEKYMCFRRKFWRERRGDLDVNRSTSDEIYFVGCGLFSCSSGLGPVANFYRHDNEFPGTCNDMQVVYNEKNSMVLSPRANYTDRATAACRRSDCQLLRIEGATWSAWRIPTVVFLVF
jgi:hypothetical protein